MAKGPISAWPCCRGPSWKALSPAAIPADNSIDSTPQGHPDVAQLRREYRQDGLRRSDLCSDPVEQFRRWFQQARQAELLEPNAMVLGTTDGLRPSSRTVLLKAFDQRGFVFFTNYGSRKSREIAAQPHVSLLFPWYALERQVAVLGLAERISTADPSSISFRGPSAAAWAPGCHSRVP